MTYDLTRARLMLDLLTISLYTHDDTTIKAAHIIADVVALCVALDLDNRQIADMVKCLLAGISLEEVA